MAPQVKKGLEKLYRRVEREVSEEVLEVVWGDMQGCLMQQVTKFNSLILQCYPGEPYPFFCARLTVWSSLDTGTNISLEFGEEDLAKYFRSIAEQR